MDNNAQRKVGLAKGLKRKYVPPHKKDESDMEGADNVPGFIKKALTMDGKDGEGKEALPESLKKCDPKLVEMIVQDMLDRSPGVSWKDIAGLEFAKQCVQEAVVWPMLRPDLFKGLLGPPKGILLFGPPGTGKTLIGKAIASEAGARFFSISASSLTSKWHGEGEKLVRTLFEVAVAYQPAIVFIDEIDSLLSQRTDSEFEASRRIKTEFLVQLDGVASSREDRILVVGATNRPQELDEAARRRLVKRLYIPLPDDAARKSLISNVLRGTPHSLDEAAIEQLVVLTKGYSGADLHALCKEAAYGPIRSLSGMTRDIRSLDQTSVRPINFGDFEAGLKQVRASVSQKELGAYLEWNRQYGSLPAQESSIVP